MHNLEVYKAKFKWSVCISVSPVHSLDNGACHERNLVGAGETIFDDASPGSQAACLWVPVQCIGPKVSQVIINWNTDYSKTTKIWPVILNIQL